MALSADKMVTRRDGQLMNGPVAASTKIYGGALLAFDADGYLALAADTANFVFAGVADEYVDNSAGADGALNCTFRKKGDILMKTATVVAQTNVGDNACLVSDDTVDLVGDTTNDVVAGVIVEFVDTTHVWVDIG